MKPWLASAVAEFIDPDWGDKGGMPGLGGRRARDAGFRGKKRDAGFRKNKRDAGFRGEEDGYRIYREEKGC